MKILVLILTVALFGSIFTTDAEAGRRKKTRLQTVTITATEAAPAGEATSAQEAQPAGEATGATEATGASEATGANEAIGASEAIAN